jgi:DNA ligase D
MTDDERDGIRLTHLDQELFDGAGATKRDLVEYLDAVSGPLVAQLADRALSVIRIRPGQPAFMQKNLPTYTPEWVRRVDIWSESSRRTIAYALCNDRRTLLWFANQRAVEFHPTLFRVPSPDSPSVLVIDLDPPEGEPFPAVVEAARVVRAALTDLGLAGGVKTSGSKGLHVIVPVTKATTEQVAAATRAVAARAEKLDPDRTTTAFLREERHGKVFLDATRAGGATVVSCYSPRIRPGVPVSFPVRWEDLDSVQPRDFTVHTAPALLAGSDHWRELLPEPQELPAELIDEGRRIPIARVQAMHEGKRRARARRQSDQDS